MKDIYKSIHFIQMIPTTNIYCPYFVATVELGLGDKININTTQNRKIKSYS